MIITGNRGLDYLIVFIVVWLFASLLIKLIIYYVNKRFPK